MDDLFFWLSQGYIGSVFNCFFDLRGQTEVIAEVEIHCYDVLHL